MPKSDNSDPLMEMFKPDNKRCGIISTPYATHHRVYLNQEVDENHLYVELLEILTNANEFDFIEIMINNFGGYLYTTMQIVNAIQKCAGTVITTVSGVACSAGSIIFMVGHERRMEKYSSLMCHYYGGCEYGKGNEMEASIEFNKKQYQQFNREVYKDLLTEEELTQMFNGKDFYFTAEEVIERLKLDEEVEEDAEECCSLS